jgi:hypothetical protein
MLWRFILAARQAAATARRPGGEGGDLRSNSQADFLLCTNEV